MDAVIHAYMAVTTSAQAMVILFWIPIILRDRKLPAYVPRGDIRMGRTLLGFLLVCVGVIILPAIPFMPGLWWGVLYLSIQVAMLAALRRSSRIFVPWAAGVFALTALVFVPTALISLEGFPEPNMGAALCLVLSSAGSVAGSLVALPFAWRRVICAEQLRDYYRQSYSSPLLKRPSLTR